MSVGLWVLIYECYECMSVGLNMKQKSTTPFLVTTLYINAMPLTEEIKAEEVSKKAKKEAKKAKSDAQEEKKRKAEDHVKKHT